MNQLFNYLASQNLVGLRCQYNASVSITHVFIHEKTQYAHLFTFFFCVIEIFLRIIDTQKLYIMGATYTVLHAAQARQMSKNQKAVYSKN